METDFSVNRDIPTTYGPLSGQIISSMKCCCQTAFSRRSPRLVEAMFECQVQVSQTLATIT